MPNNIIHHKFSSEINAKLQYLFILDNWHGIFALFYDYTVIALFIFLSLKFAYIYFISILVIGSRQRALATLLHESAHSVLAKNKYLNYFLGTFCSGYLIFQNFSSYLNSHLRLHHRYLGDQKRDPDLQFFQASGLYSSKTINMHLIPFIFFSLGTYLFYLVRSRLNFWQKTSNMEIISIALYYAAIIFTLTYIGLWKYFFLFWIIPFLTSFIALGWFIELAEHYPIRNTNTTFTNISMSRNRHSHWIEAFFASIHAENYHLIHHLRPKIPFWNLKMAHNILMSDFTYKSINESMGGIFISNRKQKSIFAKLKKSFPC